MATTGKIKTSQTERRTQNRAVPPEPAQTVPGDRAPHLRLSPEQVRLINDAAVLAGQSVDEYAVSAVVAAAEEAVRRYRVTELTKRDAGILAAALSDQDAAPNEALLAAAERYRKFRG